MLLFPSVCAWLYVCHPQQPQRVGLVPSARFLVLKEHIMDAWWALPGALQGRTRVRGTGVVLWQTAAGLPLLRE